MRELSLHILDIAQNSVRAGAKHITISINENERGFFVFRILDDGCGMDEEMLRKVRDPFVTTRTTRKIGLGIPFVDMVTQQCDGHLNIKSTLGKGTEVAAYFAAGHLDIPPMGDLGSSVAVLLAGAPNINLRFDYTSPAGSFVFTTEEVREVLGSDCDFANPEIFSWIGQYLNQQLQAVAKGGLDYEKLS
ncbi:ATP-binding protein [Phascolarctobacterium sp.]|uniref:ATP-binding protein n=1 Tax=Phascolarctobacterium sp. TaxID=2049039 RepID=UPI003865157E